jgi:hypothetical protein
MARVRGKQAMKSMTRGFFASRTSRIVMHAETVADVGKAAVHHQLDAVAAPLQDQRLTYRILREATGFHPLCLPDLPARASPA